MSQRHACSSTCMRVFQPSGANSNSSSIQDPATHPHTRAHSGQHHSTAWCGWVVLILSDSLHTSWCPPTGQHRKVALTGGGGGGNLRPHAKSKLNCRNYFKKETVSAPQKGGLNLRFSWCGAHRALGWGGAPAGGGARWGRVPPPTGGQAGGRGPCGGQLGGAHGHCQN